MAGGFQGDAFQGDAFSTTIEVSFEITESKDIAAFEANTRTYGTFNITEAIDTGSFEIPAGEFDIVELVDGASFRAFAFNKIDGDAFVIDVPMEIQSVALSPSFDNSIMSPQNITASVPDEWQRIDVDQTRAARRKE